MSRADAYDVVALYRVWPYVSIALHTTVAFWLASLALLLARQQPAGCCR